MKMKAAIYYGPGDIRVEEIERPKVSDGFQGMGIIVKIKDCGICLSEDIPRYKRKILECATGIAHGHEWSGDVVEIGPKVTAVKVGDRVWGRSFLPCGKCAECLAKHYVKCKNFIQGMTGRWLPGAFAEYMLFPYVIDDPSMLVKLPKDVGYREAALTEPMRLCLGLAAKAQTSDVAVILGQGFQGLGTLARLKAMGVAKVFVTDVSKKRLERSRELGADAAIDELNEDVLTIVMKETSGVGATAVFETSGRPGNFQLAIDLLKSGRPDGGTMWIAAPFDGPFVFHPSLQRPEMPSSSLTGKRGIAIRQPWGTLGNGPMHVRSLEFVHSSKITDKAVTHVFSLDKIKEAFETAINSPDAIKVMIEP